MSNEGSSVNYSVKEILAMLEKTLTDQISQIAVRIEEVNRKLDQKASEVRVETLEKKVADNEKRLIGLEIAAASNRAVSLSNKWLLTAVGLPIFGSIATLVWLASGGH